MNLKKTVGILTLPIKSNYGGIIQCLSLYDYLEDQGYEVVLIRKVYRTNRIKSFFRKILSHNPLYNVYDVKNLTRKRLENRLLDSFIISSFACQTKIVSSEQELRNVTKHLDAIVVGSDQVWRKAYIKDDYTHYFLDFADNNQILVSYAASFGNSSWEGDKTSSEIVNNLLERFDAISVREMDGVSICKDLGVTKDVHHVLDPVFLNKREYYIDLIQESDIKLKKGLFNYILDRNSSKNILINKIADTLSLEISSITLDETGENNKSRASMSTWISNFYNADFIVTDSFHGTLFSIIFRKNFLVVGNEKRGLARFESILKCLDLENRLIVDFSNYEEVENIIVTSIDYKAVDDKLALLKNQSKNFLNNALGR